MPKPTLDLESYFKDNNLTFSGMGDDGKAIVKDASGKEAKFDVDAFVKDEFNLSPKEVDIKWNTPETALDSGVVDLLDRVAISFGTNKGAAKRLRSKFEDVAQTDDGLSVKHKGVWQRVDPKSFGDDPYSITREILGDTVADAIPTLANIAATGTAATLGTLAAGPVGGVAAAGAAGAASGALRTSLGKLWGTYEATPEEEVKDIGLETLLSLGGQSIAAGARPGLGMLVNAAKGVASKMSPATRNMFTSLLGGKGGAGVGKEAMNTLLDAPSQVAGSLKSSVKALGDAANPEQLATRLKESSVRGLKRMLSFAEEGSQKVYDDALTGLFKATDAASIKFKPQEFSDDILKELSENGFISFADDGVRALTPDEIAMRTAQGLPVPGSDSAVAKKALEVAKMMQGYSKLGSERLSSLGEVSGVKASRILSGINKELSDLEADILKSNNKELIGGVSKMKSNILNKISQKFDASNLGSQWAQVGEALSLNNNALTVARQKLYSGGEDAFLEAVTKGSGANFVPTDEMTRGLLELGGDRARREYQDALIDHAASKFTPWAPQMGLVKAGTIATAAFKSGIGAPLVAGSAIAASSPRTVMNATAGATAIARKSLDFVKSLTPPMRAALLKSEPAMAALMKAHVLGQNEQDELEENLVNQAVQ